MANRIFNVFLALILASAMSLLAQNVQKQQPTVDAKKKTPVKIIEYIVGKWKLVEIYKGNKNVTVNDSAALNQSLSFNREGRFVSYKDNIKSDSGAYRINEEHAILYLESVWKDNSVSEWNVWFKKNRMSLQRRASTPDAESYKYIYSQLQTSRPTR
jgi:hypothetical protein